MQLTLEQRGGWGANPHATENPYVTSDSTFGPLHMWIQPIVDRKVICDWETEVGNTKILSLIHHWLNLWM